MININLENGQSGYEIIGEYIRRYWKHHNNYDDVIVALETSYNGKDYVHFNETAILAGHNDIEFENDWWEGERFIKLIGIISVDELDISGGIYDD